MQASDASTNERLRAERKIQDLELAAQGMTLDDRQAPVKEHYRARK